MAFARPLPTRKGNGPLRPPGLQTEVPAAKSDLALTGEVKPHRNMIPFFLNVSDVLENDTTSKAANKNTRSPSQLLRLNLLTECSGRHGD